MRRARLIRSQLRVEVGVERLDAFGGLEPAPPCLGDAQARGDQPGIVRRDAPAQRSHARCHCCTSAVACRSNAAPRRAREVRSSSS